MIALNIVLMALVVLAIAFVLARAIIHDRHSKRTSGGAVHPSDASLSDDLVMPHEMRTRRPARTQDRRNRGTGSPTA
jgi:hypothetical protein